MVMMVSQEMLGRTEEMVFQDLLVRMEMMVTMVDQEPLETLGIR